MTERDSREALLALRYIGTATADALGDVDVTESDITTKRVSHSDLIDAGVNAGVAARIRREHSLPWSFEGGQDLDRRAEQVRGLHDAEREWVAASYDSADASTDGSGDTTAEEAAWREKTVSHSDQNPAEEDKPYTQKPWPNEGVEDGERNELAWRKRSKPTPVTVLEDIENGDAKLLARAGITSVRSLGATNTERTAESLEIPVTLLKDWKRSAREWSEQQS